MGTAHAMPRLKARPGQPLLPCLLLALCATLGLAASGLCQDAGNATADNIPQANASISAAQVQEFRSAPGEPPAGTTWTEPKTGMAFLWVPSGCFVMGSPATEPGRNLDEGPQHEVCVSGFWLGKTEVTQGQWKAVTGKNPSLIANGDDYPVDMISWDMAKSYAAALGKKSGGSFRLPTEAEWEYAARAGTLTPYAFGETISQEQASFEKRYSLPAERAVTKRSSRKSRRKAVKYKVRTWPNMHTNVVASFQPNAFGLYDMHGNTWEWCEDVYDAHYYARSPRVNPLNTGEGVSRVLRGGSWVTKASTLRSANRSRGWPDLHTAFYGLRLVRPSSADKDKPGHISSR
ncbi:MAG: formylglycine-generating enzyme family protein [Proteobacteria bacterium]|nr:formylglycine-generating enzyme family protein [Pseudomonadota bacterium]